MVGIWITRITQRVARSVRPIGAHDELMNILPGKRRDSYVQVAEGLFVKARTLITHFLFKASPADFKILIVKHSAPVNRYYTTF